MKNILIVEDEAIVARDIWRRLEFMGYEPVACTPKGEESLDLAAKFLPDLVLMDIALAGTMDGIAAADAIRQRYDIPVVFLTAYIGDANLERVNSAEPFGYIGKPVEDGELRAAIETALYKHQSEKALRELNQRLREREIQMQVVLESTADGILAVDNKGKVVMFNRRFTELWGVPESLVALGDDKALLSFVLNQVADHGAFLAKIDSLYGSAETISDTVEFKDGRIYERHSAPTMSDGAVTGRVWSFRDITERKMAEIQRERLARELERKNHELENFLYAASHDLRSPMLNIQGFGKRLGQSCGDLAGLLAQAKVEPEQRQKLDALLQDSIAKSIRFMQTSVEKMDVLIGGLLRLSRLGQVAMRIEKLDVGAMLKHITASMAFQIQNSGAQVEVGPLPACEGDAMLVNQVFSNLLDNAIKYRDPRRPLQIHVTGALEGGEAVYCVSDTGAGIAPEQRDQIWELFRRLNPNGTEAGEGLGLNLVRRVIERHRGRIWVESEPGRGSRFFVALPLPAPEFKPKEGLS